MRKSPRYIPAFHFHWLTRWYDPVMRSLFPEEALKTALIAQARILPGQNVLDVGCGTGTLTLLIKQIQPDAIVYGLDMDSQVLRHRAKEDQTGGKNHRPATGYGDSSTLSGRRFRSCVCQPDAASPDAGG